MFSVVVLTKKQLIILAQVWKTWTVRIAQSLYLLRYFTFIFIGSLYPSFQYKIKSVATFIMAATSQSTYNVSALLSPPFLILHLYVFCSLLTFAWLKANHEIYIFISWLQVIILTRTFYAFYCYSESYFLVFYK